MQATIQDILLDRLKALQATDLVGLNGNYALTSGRPHLRLFHLPGSLDTESFGTAHYEEQRGVFQVSVFATLGKGPAASTAKADAIIAHFPTTWSETRDGVTVQVEGRRAHPGQIDPDGWWIVPVDVLYLASRTVVA
jgi:Bacteriophage related domain of unknown function